MIDSNWWKKNQKSFEEKTERNLSFIQLDNSELQFHTVIVRKNTSRL